jgi:hypothetical protein
MREEAAKPRGKKPTAVGCGLEAAGEAPQPARSGGEDEAVSRRTGIEEGEPGLAMVGDSNRSKRSWRHLGSSVAQPGVTAGVDGQPTADVVSVVGRGELGVGGVTVEQRYQPWTLRSMPPLCGTAAAGYVPAAHECAVQRQDLSILCSDKRGPVPDSRLNFARKGGSGAATVGEVGGPLA